MLSGRQSKFAHGDNIGDGAVANCSFPILKAKDVGRLGRHHFVDPVGIEANMPVRVANFIEQIAHSGERGVAADHYPVDGINQMCFYRAVEEELIRGGTDNQRGAAFVQQSYTLFRQHDAMHKDRAVVERTHAMKPRISSALFASTPSPA